MNSQKAPPFSMLEVLPYLPLPPPPTGRSSYNMDCPLCGDRKKHLNINLAKNVMPSLWFSGWGARIGCRDTRLYNAGSIR